MAFGYTAKTKKYRLVFLYLSHHAYCPTFKVIISFLTLCILMDFPIHIKAVRMGLSITYFKGVTGMNLQNYDAFLSLKSAKAEMPHSVAFQLGLHCLQKYPCQYLIKLNLAQIIIKVCSESKLSEDDLKSMA